MCGMLDFIRKLWELARPYRMRLFLGVFTGILAGLMAPLLIAAISAGFQRRVSTGGTARPSHSGAAGIPATVAAPRPRRHGQRLAGTFLVP